MIRVEYHQAGHFTEMRMIEENTTSSANLGRFYWPTEKFEQYKRILENEFPDVQFLEKEPV